MHICLLSYPEGPEGKSAGCGERSRVQCGRGRPGDYTGVAVQQSCKALHALCICEGGVFGWQSFVRSLSRASESRGQPRPLTGSLKVTGRQRHREGARAHLGVLQVKNKL
jgi:hypothetical protein